MLEYIFYIVDLILKSDPSRGHVHIWIWYFHGDMATMKLLLSFFSNVLFGVSEAAPHHSL